MMPFLFFMLRVTAGKRQKVLEDQIARGKADETEIRKIAEEIASFVEEQPLQTESMAVDRKNVLREKFRLINRKIVVSLLFS